MPARRSISPLAWAIAFIFEMIIRQAEGPYRQQWIDFLRELSQERTYNAGKLRHKHDVSLWLTRDGLIRRLTLLVQAKGRPTARSTTQCGTRLVCRGDRVRQPRLHPRQNQVSPKPSPPSKRRSTSRSRDEQLVRLRTATSAHRVRNPPGTTSVRQEVIRDSREVREAVRLVDVHLELHVFCFYMMWFWAEARMAPRGFEGKRDLMED
ncbi:MAG: hypothetical protein MMC33_002438 [Icmadophila ericetorum]|nr:hypothetical protein [Icmadophila ericetorum]